MPDGGVQGAYRSRMHLLSNLALHPAVSYPNEIHSTKSGSQGLLYVSIAWQLQNILGQKDSGS